MSVDRKEYGSGSLERKPTLSFESKNSFTYISMIRFEKVPARKLNNS